MVNLKCPICHIGAPFKEYIIAESKIFCMGNTIVGQEISPMNHSFEMKLWFFIQDSVPQIFI